MKAAHVAIAQLAVLAATAVVLLATSRSPCSTNTPETQVFAVSGDCGPSGTMSITSTAACTLLLDGGEPLFLPIAGEQPAVGPIRGQNIRLQTFVKAPDGGTVPLADGGVRPFARPEQTGLCVGCDCNGATDGGVITLTCSTDDGPAFDTCTAVLTPMP
jgi:hypothetical protein